MSNDKYKLALLQVTANKTLYFQETTILFLVKGDLMVEVENQEFALVDGDLLVFNPNESIKITRQFRKETALFEIQIDSMFFSSLYPRFFSTKFECFPSQMETGKREAITNMKKHVAELLISHYSADMTKELRLSMNLHQIILLLIQFFQKEANFYQYHLYNEKIVEVIDYIGQSYHLPLTLEQVAGHFFMSSSALSKLFKAETGHYFSHYLNNLRVRQSLRDLLHSRLGIDDIAQNNGFSNSKTYRVHFKRVFGTSPVKYRQTFFNNNEDISRLRKPQHEELLKEQETDLLAALYYYAHQPEGHVANIEVVETHKKLSIKTQNVREQINADIIVHVDTFEDLLHTGIREEIRQAKNAINLKYIGIQNLFHDTPDAYRVYEQEKLTVFSPYGKFDAVLDFLESMQLGVFYQLSLTDYEMISSFYKRERQQFLRHIAMKKGSDFFKTWKVACLFNQNDLPRSVALFKEIQHTLHGIDPEIQLGAELPVSYPDYTFQNDELCSLYLNQVIPECRFLSFRSEPNYTYETANTVVPDLEKFYEFVYKEVKALKGRLSDWHIDLPLYLSEWNTLTGKSRTTNGMFFRGALVLQEVLKLDLQVAGYGFWLNTDLFENNHPIKPIKYDGLELYVNYAGKRPIFHVLAIANRLKGKVLAIGEEFMLTKHYDNYQLLLWNANYFAPHLSKEESFLESQSMTFRIEIPEIESRTYQVKQLDFNRQHGAIFYAYEEFKSSEPLDYESHIYLSEISRPKMQVFDLEVRDGFDFYCMLDTNAVMLLELTAVN